MKWMICALLFVATTAVGAQEVNESPDYLDHGYHALNSPSASGFFSTATLAHQREAFEDAYAFYELALMKEYKEPWKCYYRMAHVDLCLGREQGFDEYLQRATKEELAAEVEAPTRGEDSDADLSPAFYTRHTPAEVAFFLATSAHRRGDFAEAYGHYRVALAERHSEPARCHYRLAQTCLRLGRKRKAREYLRLAILLDVGKPIQVDD